eukprot:CAMPEP_0113590034 /NCGR_PEP_ID=MMETSP0015_2-20120614/36438_1 /TAXON_ID=2838 /ORGANISM="Odontella" /LENGTH=119 /DNA_ID=CAMNT_0000496157 /DNA_START=138 /DNA_END=493 /DNA_ORIENTATION=+ /assembly_acc=CAM_ASM_000160
MTDIKARNVLEPHSRTPVAITDHLGLLSPCPKHAPRSLVPVAFAPPRTAVRERRNKKISAHTPSREQRKLPGRVSAPPFMLSAVGPPSSSSWYPFSLNGLRYTQIVSSLTAFAARVKLG